MVEYLYARFMVVPVKLHIYDTTPALDKFLRRGFMPLDASGEFVFFVRPKVPCSEPIVVNGEKTYQWVEFENVLDSAEYIISEGYKYSSIMREEVAKALSASSYDLEKQTKEVSKLSKQWIPEGQARAEFKKEHEDFPGWTMLFPIDAHRGLSKDELLALYKDIQSADDIYKTVNAGYWKGDCNFLFPTGKSNRQTAQEVTSFLKTCPVDKNGYRIVSDAEAKRVTYARYGVNSWKYSPTIRKREELKIFDAIYAIATIDMRIVQLNHISGDFVEDIKNIIDTYYSTIEECFKANDKEDIFQQGIKQWNYLFKYKSNREATPEDLRRYLNEEARN
ncbi:MAG: hypothetical protein IJ875_04285 [Solobacterium sp.]|nr:hypothetical protein [Solobacterium sp.]